MGSIPVMVAGDSDHVCVSDGDVNESPPIDLCHAAVSGSADISIMAIVRVDSGDVRSVSASFMESDSRCSAFVNISSVLVLSEVENVRRVSS